ncbi:MAG: carotene biosynthesis protein [Anditalea sp.]
MVSNRGWFYVFSSLLILGVVALGYFIPRISFYSVLILFTGLFILYLAVYQYAGSFQSLKHFLWLAVILRLVLLFSLPQWSDDYVRFVWDGQLLLEGHNPYVFTPTEALGQLNLQSREFLDQLYPRLNSPNYHSVYPPSNQLVFGLAASLAGENLLYAVMVIRLVLIAFEVLAFYLIYHLLVLLNRPVKKVLLYALNPLVILEISGNLHFEGLMLTLMMGGIYVLFKKKYMLSGVLLGAAVGVKLSPLMLVPAFMKWLPRQGLVPFLSGGTIMGILGLAPLLWEDAFIGFWTSLRLYGESFEFNASVYYILRQLGYWTNGYNMIGFFNPILGGLTLVLIIWLSLKVRKEQIGSLIQSLLCLYWVYFILNAVVHPWYIIPALAISVFTEKKAFLIWSFFIFLSYHAYQTTGYKELAWILSLEYLAVFLALYRDYGSRIKKLKKFPRSLR